MKVLASLLLVLVVLILTAPAALAQTVLFLPRPVWPRVTFATPVMPAYNASVAIPAAPPGYRLQCQNGTCQYVPVGAQAPVVSAAPAVVSEVPDFAILRSGFLPSRRVIVPLQVYTVVGP